MPQSHRDSNTGDLSAPSFEELCKRIRALLLEEFAPGLSPPLTDEDDLSARKVLDSLRMLEFVLQVERVCGVRVDAADITPENFGSVAAIARYILGRRGG